jgi:hypothetical protein
MDHLDELAADVFGIALKPARHAVISPKGNNRLKDTFLESSADGAGTAVDPAEISSVNLRLPPPMARSSVLPSSSLGTSRPRANWTSPLTVAQVADETRDERIRERWGRQLAAWNDHVASLARRVGRKPEELVINSLDAYREHAEVCL